MRQIPPALTIEKNRLATENPWLVLLDVFLTDTTFNLVANTEDVVFQGVTYTAVPFDIQLPEESSQGKLPTVPLRISNVTRVLQAYLEQLNGAVGSRVLMRIVNAAYLAEDYSDLEMEFTILGASCNAQWITFTLGAPSPLRKRFPLHRYIAAHCNWQPNSIECGLTGITCPRTFTACQEHGNTRRFGGFMGLSGSGIRLA